jgi:hypothetical protein
MMDFDVPTRFARTAQLLLLCFPCSALLQVVNGIPIQVNLTSPSADVWNYPFAANPGGNSYAAIFGSYSSTGFHPEFDNRDGQMTIRFNTEQGGVSPNLGLWSYSISSAAVSITVESSGTFRYDPTPDSYRVWLPPNDPEYMPDSDLGHAVELFGTAFRNNFTWITYGENTPYSPLGAFGKNIRTAFPVSFVNGSCVDISNNVDLRFDPAPFAIGLNSNLAPGQLVPAGTVMQFVLNVNDVHVQNYLRRSLNRGRLDLNVASIFPAEQQQSGTYPRFYTKEHLLVIGGFASAARLMMSVDVSSAQGPAGDVNGDFIVNVVDLLGVINAWGSCGCCVADVNDDRVVNVADLLVVINSWGA